MKQHPWQTNDPKDCYIPIPEAEGKYWYAMLSGRDVQSPRERALTRAVADQYEH